MRRNSATQTRTYVVIGKDDCIYRSREQKYLKHGEEIELTAEEAEILLAANLIEEKKPVQEKYLIMADEAEE